jgi:crotonobetainyl-CoA:carnitine CoA-transferase CaiB-like acyl-CoA transferase
MSETSAALPYVGLRVLDISQGFAGPYCAALLAMQGADVIKIEPPAGDWIREIGGGCDGVTSWTVIANAGKRSACIDATRPEGRALLLRLAHWADVIIQNFRPGVIERLGLGYDLLAERNPGLLFVSITGFGESGPDAQKAGSDSVLQAYTGMAHINRLPDGTPRRIPFLLPDTVTGVYAAQAIGAALFSRERTGQGRHLRISLLESCAAVQAASILDDVLSRGKPLKPATVPAGIFRTRDGFITVTSMSDRMFTSLLRVVGLDAWIGDRRFATIEERQNHSQMINDELALRLAEGSTDAWIRAFTKADVLCAKVLDYTAFQELPQAVDMQLFNELDQIPYGPIPVARIPGGERRWPVKPSPRKGEHTLEIVAAAGVDAEESAKLVELGIILQAETERIVESRIG